jgi:hypothetical protein
VVKKENNHKVHNVFSQRSQSILWWNRALMAEKTLHYFAYNFALLCCKKEKITQRKQEML